MKTNLPKIHTIPVAVSSSGRFVSRPDLIQRTRVAVPSGPLQVPSGVVGLRSQNPAAGGYSVPRAIPIALTDPSVATPNAQRMFAWGIADPFAIEWVPLGRGCRLVDVNSGSSAPDGTYAYSVDYQNGEARAGRNLNQGNPFLSLSPVRSPEWYHVTIWATEIVNRVNEAVPSQGSILAAPQTSMLRARVRWHERQGYERSVDVDIGMGVDLWVPPTPQLEVLLLVPNPASVPQPVGGFPVGSYPGWFTANGLTTGDPGYQFSTAITAAAYPVCSPVETNPPNRITYTAFPGQSDNDVGIFPLIPIPPNARRCQMASVLTADNPTGLWLFDPSNDQSIISSFGFAAGSLTTDNVIVPQQAKSLFLRPDSVVPRTVTVNFELQQ